jgi:hypothetical protein
MHKLLFSLALTAVALLFAGGEARAGQVLYDSSGFLQGSQGFTKSFDLSGPGVLTVTLTNVDWPTKLAGLDALLSNSSGRIGQKMGEGVTEVEVDGGRIYANWFGQAQGPFNVGVYGMKIEFQPNQQVVPLPTSLALLASGLLLLAWQRRTSGSAGDKAVFDRGSFSPNV